VNVNEAYERQTDLIRGLQRPDSVERVWFEDYAAHLTSQNTAGSPMPWVAFSDPNYVTRRSRDTDEMTTHVVIDYKPRVRLL